MLCSGVEILVVIVRLFFYYYFKFRVFLGEEDEPKIFLNQWLKTRNHILV